MCLLHVSTITVENIGTAWENFIALGNRRIFLLHGFKNSFIWWFVKLKNHSAMKICILILDFKMLESLCFLTSGQKGLQKIPKSQSYMKIDKGVLKTINLNKYSGTHKKWSKTQEIMQLGRNNKTFWRNSAWVGKNITGNCFSYMVKLVLFIPKFRV